jgi:hypothetical protein
MHPRNERAGPHVRCSSGTRTIAYRGHAESDSHASSRTERLVTATSPRSFPRSASPAGSPPEPPPSTAAGSDEAPPPAAWPRPPDCTRPACSPTRNTATSARRSSANSDSPAPTNLTSRCQETAGRRVRDLRPRLGMAIPMERSRSARGGRWDLGHQLTVGGIPAGAWVDDKIMTLNSGTGLFGDKKFGLLV